ncbi:MAG: class I SAM-dependent methyltransferase [Bacteroidia bacterium]|nr:MAG: class I SAM-dependent methyltransferase [Bacteroidia bacterium]
MQYDPIKKLLGNIFNKRPLTRKLFYGMLDILLLRTWHIHLAIRQFARQNAEADDIRVLDAGSGLGQYSWYVARKYPKWHIEALDIKKEEIESCRRFFKSEGKTNVRFVHGDLLHFVEADKFDLILSVDVMEHIENDRLVFSNFFRALKPGGMLLVSTPSDRGGSDVRQSEDDSFIEEHVRDGYSIHEIDEKLKKAGFNKSAITYTYGRPGSIAWRLSMKYPLLMLSMSKAFLLLLPVYYLFTMPVVLILHLADVKTRHQTGTGLMVKAWK